MPSEIRDALGPIPQDGATIEECVETIKTTFEYSMKTMHPFFNDKLYYGTDPVGQMAEYIVSILNTNSHVFHVSPVFSVMEKECAKIFGQSFGYNPEKLDGIFNPGGSMSLMTSFICARHTHFPHVRMEGWKAGDNPVAYTSN